MNKEREWEKWESLTFALDTLLKEMDDHHVTYQKLARWMGTSKGNMHRDLHRRGVAGWRVDRLLRLFEVMGFKLQCSLVALKKAESEGK